MNIRIDKCTDPRAWYANRVGQILPVERFEKNRHPSQGQGIPEDVYWCREGGTYNAINYVRASDARETITLHLVLTHHWYDETVKAGDPKRIEYRKVTPRWLKLIYDRRDIITGVRFSRGYTSTIRIYRVTGIDIGPCPISGWAGEFIRIHFEDMPPPAPV